MIDDVEARVRALYARLTAGSGSSRLLTPLIAVTRWIVVFYGKLVEHRAFLRAGAMAYATLVALVPLLLLVFGVLHAVAPGQDLRVIESMLFSTFLGGMPEIREVLLPGLRQVDLGTVGVFGTLGLLVVAANLYMTAERAYSDIFEVPVRRRLTRRMLNFYFLVTAVPVVSVFAALSTVEAASAYGAPWVRHLLAIGLPWMMLVGALKLFPSTEVRWRPALLGGTVSAILLRAGTFAFTQYVEMFATGNAVQVIYGSLALIPIFLAWLYLLWVAVLLGVEVAHIAQNFRSLVEEEDAQRAGTSRTWKAPGVADALRVLGELARAFADGRGPVARSELSGATDLRASDVDHVLHIFEQDGLVAHLPDGRLVLTRSPDNETLATLAAVWRDRTRPGAEDAVDVEVDGATAALSGTLIEAVRRWDARRAENRS